jgi:hypothetical protein
MSESSLPRTREFGSITPTDKTKDLPRAKQEFRARYTHRGMKYECLGGPFKTKQLARRALNEVQITIQSGNWRPPIEGDIDLRRLTLRQLAESYISTAINPLTGRFITSRTAKDYRYYLDSKAQIAHLADRPLVSITSVDIEKWYRAKREHSATMAVRVYEFLKAMFNEAIRRRIVSESPCQIRGGTSLPRKVRPIPSREEARAIMENLSYPFRLAYALGSVTTIRTSEILALTNHDLKPYLNANGETRWAMSISKSVNWDEGSAKPRIMSANKTLETTREVPVSPTLNPFIEEHLRTIGDPEEETPLFTMPTGEKGRLFGRNTLLNAFKQAQKPLGLNYSFHDTRSYALTHIGKNSAVGRGDLMALSGITNSRTLDRYTKTTGLEEITEQLDFF